MYARNNAKLVDRS